MQRGYGSFHVNKRKTSSLDNRPHPYQREAGNRALEHNTNQAAVHQQPPATGGRRMPARRNQGSFQQEGAVEVRGSQYRVLPKLEWVYNPLSASPSNQFDFPITNNQSPRPFDYESRAVATLPQQSLPMPQQAVAPPTFSNFGTINDLTTGHGASSYMPALTEASPALSDGSINNFGGFGFVLTPEDVEAVSNLTPDMLDELLRQVQMEFPAPAPSNGAQRTCGN